MKKKKSDFYDENLKLKQEHSEKAEPKKEESLKEILENDHENIQAMLNRSDRIYDLLELAQLAETNEEAIYYAEEILALDPDNLDAELIIVKAKARSFGTQQKALKRLLAKAEKVLVKIGIDKEKEMGCFYGLIETRPYMRVHYHYLQTLLALGKMGLALQEAEEMIRLNENDNGGIRYTLMALYAHFEDEEKAQALLSKYPHDDTSMLLPLIALYYRKDNQKQMRVYIDKLQATNSHVIEALYILDDDDAYEEVATIVNARMYQRDSAEEVITCFVENGFLYEQLPEFTHTLIKELKK